MRCWLCETHLETSPIWYETVDGFVLCKECGEEQNKRVEEETANETSLD